MADLERRARMALCAVSQPGDAVLAESVAAMGAQTVWQALLEAEPTTIWRRRAKAVDPDEVAEASAASGARFLIPGDDEWPERLDDLAEGARLHDMGGPPLGLWVRGRLRLDEVTARSVAVVGARAATGYGEGVATDLAAELAQAGWCVVSGGAYGIDAAAHRGTLAVDGVTVAVVNNGLDIAYPRGNARLLADVAERGLVVGECPPGRDPTRHGFLARNRVIAALAAGVVVVEAAARSGAKNTAAWGNALGRLVMAVPGPVHSALSETPHRLIRDQEAVLVSCRDDVLAMLTPIGQGPELATGGMERPLDKLGARELAVREQLPARGSRSVGELCVLTGFDPPTCLSLLAGLSEGGWAELGSDGMWRLADGGRHR